MNILATVTHESVDLDPKNFATNTFAISAPEVNPENQFGGITDALHSFFSSLDSVTTLSIDNHLSQLLRRTANGRVVNLYDITGKELATGSPNPKPPPHGSPVYTEKYSIGASYPNAQSLPEEVAVCMTLRAINWDTQPIERADGLDAGTAIDRPRQRYSGRVFLGPLNVNALSSSQQASRVKDDLINTILGRADALWAALNALGCSWDIWSRSDGVLRVVDVAQVDNEFDTQRRRGVKATARTSMTLS